MKNISLLTLLLFLSALSIFAQESSSKQRLDSLVDILENNNRWMGTVTITKNGEVWYSNAAGFSDRKNKIPSESSTRYRIGSISKMFTATVIFQLMEENKLSMDTKLSTFLPEMPNADLITIANLLRHQSGLYNFTNDTDYLKWNTKFHTREELREMIQEQGSVVDPGGSPSYSNTNYLLLTMIIEEVCGKPYGEIIKNRITDKINLSNTYYAEKSKEKTKSYHYAGDHWDEISPTDMSIPLGAGGIISTTYDLTQFVHALFHDKLMSESSRSEMLRFIGPYGYGIFQFPFYDKKAYGHNGGIDGFQSTLAYFPEEDVAIAVTTNGVRENMNNLLIGFLSLTFDRDYKMPEYSDYKVDKNKLKKYEGIFSSSQLPLKLDFKVQGNELTAQATNQPRMPLEPIAPNIFVFRDAGAEFIFNDTAEEVTLKQAGQQFLFKKDQ